MKYIRKYRSASRPIPLSQPFPGYYPSQQDLFVASGYSSGYGGYGNGPYAESGMKVRRRHKIPFPFVPIPDFVESKEIRISAKKLSCFHGFSSIFTLQHRAFFMIDGMTYKSIDQYYQIRKVTDLTGMGADQFIDGSTDNYSVLARNLLKQNGIDRDLVDQWRVTAGVEAIQKGVLEKVRQYEPLRNAIIQTGDRLIVQTYAADDFFGCGVPLSHMKDWAASEERSKSTVKIPVSFPLTSETMQYVPTVGKGRNILGTIFMILREKINNGQLGSLDVKQTAFSRSEKKGSVIQSSSVIEDLKQGSPLVVPGGQEDRVPHKEQQMEIDFTVDYDPDLLDPLAAVSGMNISSSRGSSGPLGNPPKPPSFTSKANPKRIVLPFTTTTQPKSF